MNEEAKKTLKRLLETDVNDLKPWNIAFLKARASYLTKQQRKNYKALLKKKVKLPKPPADETYISYKDLQKRAKEYNLPYKGVDRSELEQAIRTIEGPEYFRKEA